MIKTMPYWLYKSGYSMFPASNYNAGKKSIDVELPDYKKPRWPKEWERSGNHIHADNDCVICFWGSGLAEHYEVEHWHGPKDIMGFTKCETKTFPAGLYARQSVIDYILSLNR
jgi:hypothetical protein